MAYSASTTAVGTGGADQVTINVPTNSDGDVLVFLTDHWNETVTWGFTPAATGTFNVVGNSGREGHFMWATKVASSEPANYTISLGGGNGFTVKAVAASFSGRSSATPSASTATDDAGNSATPISTPLGGVTAASGDDIVIVTGVASSNVTGSSTFTAPANYTTRQNASNTGAFDGGGVAIATRDNVSAGATGTLTGSWVLGSGNADTAGAVLAFAASGGGSSIAAISHYYRMLRNA
jgi:hypothetical protein